MFDGRGENTSPTVWVYGVDSGSLVAVNSTSDYNQIVIPQTGNYYFIVDSPELDAPYDFTVTAANDPINVPLINLDTVYSDTTATGDSNKYFRFNGTAGQSILFNVQDVGFSSSTEWILQRPDGSVIFDSFSLAPRAEVLTQTGEYLLSLIGGDSVPIDYSFSIVTPTTSSTTYTLGNTVNSALTEPGEVDEYTFTGVAGQRLVLDTRGTTDTVSYSYDLQGPTAFTSGNSSGDSIIYTLTTSGDYKLRIRAAVNTNIGNYSFALLDLAAATQISLDTNVGANLNPNDQLRTYRFTGAKDQVIFYEQTANDPFLAIACLSSILFPGTFSVPLLSEQLRSESSSR